MVIRLVSCEEAEMWIVKYGKTKRMYYLHPHQLEYKSPQGAIIRPLQESAWNVDDDENLNSAKMALLMSENLRYLDFEKRVLLCEQLGVPEKVMIELSRLRPVYKRVAMLLEVSENYLKAEM